MLNLRFETGFGTVGACIVVRGRGRVAVFITVTFRILEHEHPFVTTRGAIEMGVAKQNVSDVDIVTGEFVGLNKKYKDATVEGSLPDVIVFQ